MKKIFLVIMFFYSLFSFSQEYRESVNEYILIASKLNKTKTFKKGKNVEIFYNKNVIYGKIKNITQDSLYIKNTAIAVKDIIQIGNNKKINRILLPFGIATTAVGAILVYMVIPSEFALVGLIFTVPIVVVGVAITTISLLNKHDYNKHEYSFKTQKIN
jgi:hypothetical protein